MSEMLQKNLSAFLPDVSEARGACVHRLIGSLSGREGFEYVFAAEAVCGEPVQLCIHL